jgi:hypothetical protein
VTHLLCARHSHLTPRCVSLGLRPGRQGVTNLPWAGYPSTPTYRLLGNRINWIKRLCGGTVSRKPVRRLARPGNGCNSLHSSFPCHQRLWLANHPAIDTSGWPTLFLAFT